jgi:RNA polymerase sigma factor for flagellar operon FliA
MSSSPESVRRDRTAGAGTADDLIEQHLSLVTVIARKILATLPGFVEMDDLVGFGRIGLVEAARRFDPSRGVLFQTFAYYRIRGAVYDGIRKMAWFPSQATPGLRFEAGAAEVMEDACNREGGERGPGSVEERISETRETIEGLAMVRLLSLPGEGEIDLPDTSDGPLEITGIRELAALVQGCVARLDEKERSVIEDYYFRDLTLEEAGAKLGLSKSWTSRLHARALGKLLRMCEKCGLTSAP